MASYHIRKYQESDNDSVLALFSSGLTEHIPATFRHMLMLPRMLLFLLGVPLTVLLVTSSWLLTIMSSFTLLVFLRLLAAFPWKVHEALCLRTDLADITKNYMSECGSCYWVAESEGQVVGTVSALPVADPPLGKKQLQLLHLSVAKEHRGKGIAKALVRTLIQFARVQGYNEVFIETTTMHYSALALYQAIGFQKKSQIYYSMIWRILDVPKVDLTYHLPSAQEEGL
ncbi:N-acetyltransferase 8F1 [Ictidomys tridecemlineatus]|uniref:probable N-acetyltransferase CML1 n=1 Tax=Ictidomys tridecemlineatus TaxID=43179 RepID=UPI00038C0309|nr:probable N-acetyltransferase CML1 [Ictidomys tridecemlineatus]XP_040127059.1 probable N-acetyltransferase CML1 [Ictidomys tridecemlineatus]KAG3267079.1 putative N-acetyltransferase CML1 [Ictidomys tridecemlineatus]